MHEETRTLAERSKSVLKSHVDGEPFMELAGGMFPKNDGGMRSIWEIPNDAQQTLLVMMWASLGAEILNRISVNSPGRKIVEDAVTAFQESLRANNDV